MATPARAGPITRPRLNWADDSEMAANSSSVHQVGQHGLVGGKADRGHDPASEHQQGHDPRAGLPGGRQGGQPGGKGGLTSRGDQQPATPVEAVGHGATHRREESDGHKGSRRHQSGPPSLVGTGGNQHTYRHRLHPRPDVGHQGSRPEQGEVAPAQRMQRSKAHAMRVEPVRRLRPGIAGAPVGYLPPTAREEGSCYTRST